MVVSYDPAKTRTLPAGGQVMVLNGQSPHSSSECPSAPQLPQGASPAHTRMNGSPVHVPSVPHAAPALPATHPKVSVLPGVQV